MIAVLDSTLLLQKCTAIVEFLRKSQAEDGEFRTLRFFQNQTRPYGVESEFAGWYYFGKCPFSTANVLHHLREVELPHVDSMIQKGCEFLSKGVENGVFRYIPAYHQRINFPADIDDTSLALAVLKENGYSPTENLPMIFGNQTSDGNFYTWFMPRLRHASNISNFLWLCKDVRRSYLRAKRFGAKLWKLFREHQFSAEPAITANVILYLGENKETIRFIDSLIEQIERGNAKLQYYDNILWLYFHVARLYHSGIRRVECLKEIILKHISDSQRADGQIENGFNTAVSALILIYFDSWDNEALQRALHYLAFDTMHQEGWRPEQCCNDQDGIFIEGSAEYTASLYLESLHKYSKRLDAGSV